jgi:hypothetical protein
MTIFDIDPVVKKEVFSNTILSLDKIKTLQFESIYKNKNGDMFPVEVVSSK